jgi:predicted deacylase
MSAITLRDGVVMQRLAAEAVLLDVQAGCYFELNASGVVVLEQLLAGATLASAACELCARFEVDQASAERDSVQLLASLKQAGLIAER